jgi:hypothetical protein
MVSQFVFCSELLGIKCMDNKIEATGRKEAKDFIES